MIKLSLTFITVIALLVFGIYRKNSLYQQASLQSLVSSSIDIVNPVKKNTMVIGRNEVARMAFEVERMLDQGESIIQVHDYKNEALASGVKHIFDVTTFNRFNTQAVTKRIECLKKGDQLQILGAQLMSPITGTLVNSTHVVDELMDLVIRDDEVESDAKFVRDKYAFVTKDNELPPEPQPVGEYCTNQLNEGAKLSDRCEAEINKYKEALLEYRTQVKEVRDTGTFTEKPLIRFAPTDQTISDDQKYPFSHPTTYGYAKHEHPPLDFSVLDMIKPLKDEGFFNSIALEKSTLAIQYG